MNNSSLREVAFRHCERSEAISHYNEIASGARKRVEIAMTIYAAILLIVLLWGCKSVPNDEGGTPVSAEGSEATSSATEIASQAAQEGSNRNDGKTTPVTSPEPPRLTCLFAGDIMAHNVNYRMADYSRIWDGVRPAVSACDLAFANIEMPVDDSRPMSSYPQFNVHSPYVEAAIDAGFNVFSLVNNHTNDQGIEGMDATRKWAERRAAATIEQGVASPSLEGKAPPTAKQPRQVYFSGLKETALSPMSYAVIERGGYTVLFLAVTEILNKGDYKRNMNYIGVDKASRLSFIDVVKALRSNNPCDIFVLSVHANVTEYVHEIEPSRMEWYKRLAAAGVDVVWANHPHIVQDAMVIEGDGGDTLDADGTAKAGAASKIVMFACGNVISGQRSRPQFDEPATERDWTGDGMMMKVVFEKGGGAPPSLRAEGEAISHNDRHPLATEIASQAAQGGTIAMTTISSAEPLFITTYITPGGEYVVKMLDDDTIQSLRDEGRTKWADYLAVRKEIMAKVPMKLGVASD